MPSEFCSDVIPFYLHFSLKLTAPLFSRGDKLSEVERRKKVEARARGQKMRCTQFEKKNFNHSYVGGLINSLC